MVSSWRIDNGPAKKCRISVKAIFASILLLSWIGLHGMTIYISHYLSLINDDDNDDTKVVNSIIIVPPPSSMISHADSSRHRTRNAKKFLTHSKTKTTSSVHAKSFKTRFRRINRGNSKTRQQQQQQLTRRALHSSRPYALTFTKNPADSRHYRFKNAQPAAFAAGDYYYSSSLGDDDDEHNFDTYYAADDDVVRGSGYKPWPDGSEPICSTPSFYRLYRPNCNEMHSTVSGYHWLTDRVVATPPPLPIILPKQQQQQQQNTTIPWTRSRYLGSGMYRHVFLLERPFAANESDEVVFKCMKRFSRGEASFEKRIEYKPNEALDNFELYDDMRKDAMVMEQLAHSPRIANIYSFCSLSSIIEYAPGNIEKYVLPTTRGGYKKKTTTMTTGRERGDDDDPTTTTTPVVNNDIGGVDKLLLALELAKGIAAMHGHSDGVIANVDVQIGQFGRGKDGLVKILDFNRAEVMLYDERRGEYCRFENGKPPDGSLRSPEEIIDAPLTEKIDVYSLGNAFYSILTGLVVNGEYSKSQAHSRIIHGMTENIDVSFFESRSQAEYALVKIIQLCWTYDAEERPSIFDVVTLLENEVKSLVSA